MRCDDLLAGRPEELRAMAVPRNCVRCAGAGAGPMNCVRCAGPEELCVMHGDRGRLKELHAIGKDGGGSGEMRAKRWGHAHRTSESLLRKINHAMHTGPAHRTNFPD